MAAAAASKSEPSCITQRLPVADLQPSEERTPEEGTSESDDQAATAAEARPDEPAAEAPEKKKRDTRAAEAAHAAGGGSFGAVEPAQRPTPATAREESARERLKRHRTEMAGRVRIPDMWGQERLLKDWVDCAVFDRPLAATAGLLNARDSLVAERRPLRVHNGCS
jgi:hypothetical protein